MKRISYEKTERMFDSLGFIGGFLRGTKRSRVIGLFWFFFLIAVLLAWRLVKLQYVQHAYYLERADALHLGEASLPALRGDIRNRNDEVLAKSVARWSVAANPQLLRNQGEAEAAASALSSILQKDIEELRTLFSREAHFSWVSRKVDTEVAQAIRALEIDGVFLVLESTPGKRFYPKGRLGVQYLGKTGIDDQGLDGLEASYEKVLAGEAGLVKAFMDRDGWATLNGPAAVIKPAVHEHNLILTIDESIQYFAQKELARQVREFKASGGIVVVMDARNAEILAMAVNPDFPAEKFAEVSPELRRNRSVTDPYEPGSTFKIFLAAAALSVGVKPEQTFRSGGVLSVDGWSIHNASDGLHSDAFESLRDILAFSYNIGTTSVALHIGKESFYQHLQAFGFGQTTGIDLMGESAGLLSPASEWAAINTATISFGQGVACTPLQLCSAMQAVANGGVRVKPRIVRAITDQDGKVVKRNEPQVLGRAVSAEVARETLAILEHVCENGTGKKAKVRGFQVGGKTGTAQVAESGGYSSSKFIASFLGVAPIQDPRVVVLVKIEEPSVQWGGVVAAPVFSRVVEKALWRLGVMPDQKLEKPTSN